MKTHLTRILSSLPLVIFSVFIGYATIAYGSSVVATPAIVDLKGEARDILKGSVVLENTSSRYAELYPFVNNISLEEGKQVFLDPATADISSSFANWFELSRSSIMLQPGEKKTVDFRINVNVRAPPGIYHAAVTFAPGSTRAEAEGRLEGALQVPVNLEVQEDIRERLQLRKFIPDEVFFSGFPVTFSVDLENVGNRAVIPTGEIRIYDRRGVEVASVPLGDANAPIETDKIASLEGSWKGEDLNPFLASVGVAFSGWGQYKALLDLEYGTAQRGTINDTVFFWVIPWLPLLLIFLVFTGVALGVAFWIRRRGSPRDNE